MNKSARRQHHEQARKKHKQDQMAFAREAARRPKSAFPTWLLGASVGVMALAAVAILLAR